MLSWDIFERLIQEGRDSVLLPCVKARVVVEEASTFAWKRYLCPSGQIIGIRTFGASASLGELQRKLGFKPDRAVAAAKELLGRGGPHMLFSLN